MDGPILITGSQGLIGRALRSALAGRGTEVAGLDLRGSCGEAGDVREAKCIRDSVAGCHGIVHLAAVSRVVWAERDPQGCRDINVGGLRNVIQVAVESTRRPWLLFASSREVYGQPDHLPVTEDAPLRPVNVYGRCKAEGERLVEAARAGGLRAAVVRLSNVYGSPRDYPDRVVPAFARAAARGSPLRVEGEGNVFDFTHLDDTVRGLVALIELLSEGEAPPPIHLLTGRPTTLGRLAALAVELAGTEAPIVRAPARPFDVSREHQKLWGSSRSVWVREIRVGGLGTEGIWD
ncbi:MAG: NAD(P)-dependent oxidoreductase [Caldilineaceae bacterium]|nr:NAD(P)-dependent oxidoreductase [Caldilineaceae bacterium]